jgi:hypothetical protein
MPKAIYFFDTVNATKNYDSLLGGTNGIYYHPYNVYFPLKTPLPNVRRITLKSVEMPLTLYTIRIENGTNKIGLTFTYSTFTNIYKSFTVSPGIYTVATLISTINSTLTSTLGPTYTGLSITFTQFVSTYNTTICSINHNCTTLTIDDTPLSNYILGYTNRFTSQSSFPLGGHSPININSVDTCIYLQIPNIPNTNNSNSFTGFKLPTNNTANNSTLFYNDSEEHQSIVFNSTPFILDKINVYITDRLGFPLTGYFHWTFSLIIEYDDTTEQRQFLDFNN